MPASRELRLTIVGGQPPSGRGLPGPHDIPVGFERVLRRAAQDEAFRKGLFEQPQSAVERSGIELSRSETKMLGALSKRSLEAMIEQISRADTL
jgi:hypothetical protein